MPKKKKTDLSKQTRQTKRRRRERAEENTEQHERRLLENIIRRKAQQFLKTESEPDILFSLELVNTAQCGTSESQKQAPSTSQGGDLFTPKVKKRNRDSKVLARDRERQKRYRSLESRERREKRLELDRKRAAQRYASLPPDKKEERRAIERERKRLARASETPEQREKRLAVERKRVALRRAKNRNAERLAADKERRRQARAAETPEQRQKRLAYDRERAALRRALLTPEQKAELRAKHKRRNTFEQQTDRSDASGDIETTPFEQQSLWEIVREYAKAAATSNGYSTGVQNRPPFVGLLETPNGSDDIDIPSTSQASVKEGNLLKTKNKKDCKKLTKKPTLKGTMDAEDATSDNIKTEIDIEEEKLIRVKTENPQIPYEETQTQDDLNTSQTEDEQNIFQSIEISIKHEPDPEENEDNDCVDSENDLNKPKDISEADDAIPDINIDIKEENNEPLVEYDYPNFDDTASNDSDEAQPLDNVETCLQDDTSIKTENDGAAEDPQNTEVKTELEVTPDTNYFNHVTPDAADSAPKYSFVMKIPGEVISNIDQIVTSCLMNGSPYNNATSLQNSAININGKSFSDEMDTKMETEALNNTNEQCLLEESQKSEVFDLNPFQLNSITGNILSLEQEAYNMQKTFQCPKCSKRYKTRNALNRHLKIHQCIENHEKGVKKGLKTKRKNYLKKMKVLMEQLHEKDESQESFSERKVIKDENKIIKEEKEKEGHKCTCGKIFQRRTRMEACLKTHDCCDSEKYFCMTCHKEFKSKNELAMHRKRLHRKKFPCKFCPTDYDTRKKLFKHLQLHQRVQQMEFKVIEEVVKGKKLRCFLCLKSCEELSELKMHVMTEHKGPYLCPHCKNTFPKIIDFGNHTKAYHPEIEGQSVMDVLEAFSRLAQEWKCEECDLQFVEADKLALHQAEEHSPEIKTEHQFQCPDCRRVFISQKGLTSHRRIHHSIETSEQAPAEVQGIMCLECRKMCKDMSALTSHMRLHSLDRKYPCKFCDFRFKTPEKRKAHAEVHTTIGDMKYVCFICEYQCSSENRLKKHKQSLKHANMREYLLTGKPLLEEPTLKEKEKKEGSAKKRKKSKDNHRNDNSETNSECVEVTCDVCGEKFPSESEMLEHKQTHPFIEFPNDDKPTRIFFK